MSQLSATSESSIGTVILTETGLTGGRIARAVLRTANWLPRVSTRFDGIESPEVQEFDIGGASGTKGWPVELFLEYCPDALYMALRTQRLTLATTQAASLKLAATDASGVERTLTFSALRWLDLKWDAEKRFGSRTYVGVLATLVSEA